MWRRGPFGRPYTDCRSFRQITLADDDDVGVIHSARKKHMVLISITRLRVRSFRYLPGFILYAVLSVRQAKRAPGNLGLGLLRDADRTFWTRTAWQDEAAMRAFMMATPHRRAMAKLVEWCNEASVVHWTQESPDLPNWHEAHRKMVAEGRRSKVRHPSRAHETYDIAPPRIPERN